MNGMTENGVVDIYKFRKKQTVYKNEPENSSLYFGKV